MSIENPSRWIESDSSFSINPETYIGIDLRMLSEQEVQTIIKPETSISLRQLPYGRELVQQVSKLNAHLTLAIAHNDGFYEKCVMDRDWVFKPCQDNAPEVRQAAETIRDARIALVPSSV